MAKSIRERIDQAAPRPISEMRNPNANLPPHYKRLAHGAASYVPPLYAALLRSAAFVRRVRGAPAQEPKAAPMRHGDSAAYCYNIWLRYLASAGEDGFDDRPEAVVEIGPGDSLGVGLAALISGSSRLHAVESQGRPSVEANAAMFDELAGMFARREPAPAYSAGRRALEPCGFPHHVLDADRLEEVLAESRLNALRDSIERAITQRGGSPTRSNAISYYDASATDAALLPENSADMIFSQHTLEHIEDLPRLFRAMALWLKPGGRMAHVVDFGSHGAAHTWDGHWAYGELHWKLLRGRPAASPTARTRSWESLNRRPLTAYLDLLTRHGFETRRVERETAEPGLPRHKMAPKFRSMSEPDRTTRSAFVQARRLEN